MKKPLAQLLDKLISEAPKEHEGAVALQIQILSQSHAGSIRHSPEYDGLYEIIVADPNQKVAFSVFFEASDLTAVFIPRGAPSKIVQPSGGSRIIPGVS